METRMSPKSVKIVFLLILFLKQVTMFPFLEQEEYCETLLSQYDPQLLDRFKWEMSQGMQRFFLLSYCLACCWPVFGSKGELRIIKQWAELDFQFPSEEARARAIEQQFFIPGNSVPIDVDVQHRQGSSGSRVFVTIPRFASGRPITLGTVQNDNKILPYPDYSWHDNQGQNCDGLSSVFRVAIDQCKRLWVMDTGKIGDTQSCPPQLLAFDLASDRLIYRHVVNKTNYNELSLFITPVVDVRPRGPGDCASTFVYVADVSGFALLVVDVLNNRSWKVDNHRFFPFPSKGVFNIDGERFELMDGVFGLALSPFKPGCERNLYFHALAATTENVVSTKLIRNDSHITDSQLGIDAVSVFKEERPTQSAAEAMDSNGIMYFGLMDPPSVWCWNSATEFSPRNFHPLAIDRETLQFASGVKIVTSTQGEEELWVLTSSFQRVMTGTLSSNRVNFRIHAEKLATLLQTSPCRERRVKPRY